MSSARSLTPKQHSAIDRLSTRRSTILVAPTGAGKTVICLTAISKAIAAGKLRKIIVACPAKVLATMVWPHEAAKWDHLRKIRILQIEGTSQERTKLLLSCEAEILMISLNNLDWLLRQDHECDGIVIDELSKAAGKQSKGLKTKRRGDCFKWRVGMTATPVSQDLEKLFSLARVIDKGKAFGTSKNDYLRRYFYSDYMGYNWTLKEDGAERILNKCRKLVHLVEDTKKEDLPRLTERAIRFRMHPGTHEVYQQMKKHMVTDDVEAANAAVASGKLRQLGSGFIYDDQKKVTVYDSNRRDAAVEWWLALDKRPAVIFYEYIEQGETLARVFRKYLSDSVEEFIAGEGCILLAQINSLGHGIDGLQHVCHDALMYHPMWSRDATEQAQGRLWRTGAAKEVTITTLVCDDTLDDLVMARVEDRAEWMKLFTEHLGD
jgi:superfamily II DNA or RNA helicase